MILIRDFSFDQWDFGLKPMWLPRYIAITCYAPHVVAHDAIEHQYYDNLTLEDELLAFGAIIFIRAMTGWFTNAWRPEERSTDLNHAYHEAVNSIQADIRSLIIKKLTRSNLKPRKIYDPTSILKTPTKILNVDTPLIQYRKAISSLTPESFIKVLVNDVCNRAQHAAEIADDDYRVSLGNINLWMESWLAQGYVNASKRFDNDPVKALLTFDMVTAAARVVYDYPFNIDRVEKMIFWSRYIKPKQVQFEIDVGNHVIVRFGKKEFCRITPTEKIIPLSFRQKIEKIVKKHPRMLA